MRAHKMSYLACMDMDILDYIDYLEFDLIRHPIENDNTEEFGGE